METLSYMTAEELRAGGHSCSRKVELHVVLRVQHLKVGQRYLYLLWLLSML